MTETHIDIEHIAHLETQVGTLGSIDGLESGGDDLFEYLLGLAHVARMSA